MAKSKSPKQPESRPAKRSYNLSAEGRRRISDGQRWRWLFKKRPELIEKFVATI